MNVSLNYLLSKAGRHLLNYAWKWKFNISYAVYVEIDQEILLHLHE